MVFSKLVVLFTEVCVGENLVGFTDGLEFLLSGIVARVLVCGDLSVSIRNKEGTGEGRDGGKIYLDVL